MRTVLLFLVFAGFAFAQQNTKAKETSAPFVCSGPQARFSKGSNPTEKQKTDAAQYCQAQDRAAWENTEKRRQDSEIRTQVGIIRLNQAEEAAKQTAAKQANRKSCQERVAYQPDGKDSPECKDIPPDVATLAKAYNDCMEKIHADDWVFCGRLLPLDMAFPKSAKK